MLGSQKIRPGDIVRAISQNKRALWIALVLVSGVPRILGAFLLPNAFGDAYVYIRDIGSMSARLSAGTFSVTDLFGFWFPAYQFICAVLNLFFNDAFHVAKLVSAICGTGVCLLVFSITLRLTADYILAMLAFLLIAFNPLHILYSASAMTDVPHAFLVLGSLYLLLKKRWIPAAIFAVVAGLMRIESWMLILLLPLLQFSRERRISVAACAILMIAPALWLYICWKATGNPFAYFEVRSRYINAIITAKPELATLSLSRMVVDTGILLGSADLSVMTASLFGGWLILKRMAGHALKRISEKLYEIVTVETFFLAFLGFIVIANLTGNQPEMWLRYGLILFGLGIPLLSWTFLTVARSRPHRARRLKTAVIVVCLCQASAQFVGAAGFVNQVSAQRTVARYLRGEYDANPGIRIFCDDGTVQALSGIPQENFLGSSDSPRDPEQFLTHLRERGVEFLVFRNKGDFVPAKLFPELNRGSGNPLFQPVMHVSSRFLPIEIWLYRFQGGSYLRE